MPHGQYYQAWNSITSDLPADATPETATEFLREHHWTVRGTWDYDPACDLHRTYVLQPS